MCLIAFAWRAHPRYPLIVAANRDEFHARPTAALGRWRENQDVVGGRDRREGGSWLALREGGRLAAVTNVRNGAIGPGERSRGHLVRDFVLGDELAASYGEDVWIAGDEYGGFNLLLHDGQELIWVGNRPSPAWQSVPPGVHSVSNGAPSFDSGELPWPKMLHSMAVLNAWLRTVPADGEPDVAPLFAMLADERVAPDASLPDTGVGLEMERRLAPAFIRGTEYGTRCSTVALLGKDGDSIMIERRFGPDGISAGETRLVTSTA